MVPCLLPKAAVATPVKQHNTGVSMTYIVDYQLSDLTYGTETFNTRALAALRCIELEDESALYIYMSIQTD